MRRLLVLIALLGVMFGLRLLQTDTAEHQSALVLAAIGFVLLTSFTVAEIGSAVTLPRVTGYILTGALLAVFGILSPPVVLEMKMFNTLALGLIAISAGLELSVEQLRKVFRTLTATIVGKLFLTVPLVGAALFAFEHYLGPLGLDTPEEIGAVALVLGALSLGTSPAIALAIISETRSKGRLSDIVLGAAVLKDLVVVVTLAIAIALARGLLADGGSGGGGLSHVFLEITYSLVAGGLLGALLILYLRFVKAEMLLFVAAVILVVAEISHLLHLELLLVFIGGGFVVRNFSDHEHDLLEPVQMVSLPVFVVFFTIAGASIDLATTWRILPLALTLCAVRAAGFFVSARVGNALGKEGDAVRENAWLGYLPQAGVTLGLVGLAHGQLPTVGPAIQSTGMAVVAINLLLGPITLRAALKRAGEIPATSSEKESEAPEKIEGEEEAHPIQRLPEAAQPAFIQLERQLEHQMCDLFESGWRRWVRSTAEEFHKLGTLVLERNDKAPEQWLVLKPTEKTLTDWAEAHREIFLHARRLVRLLPEIVEVPLEDDNRRVLSTDPLSIRFRKRASSVKRGLTFVRHPVRRLPARELGRLHFEPRLAELVATLLTSRMRLMAGALEEIGEAARGTLEEAELETRLRSRFKNWEGFIRQESRDVSRRAIAALLSQAAVLDSPYLSRGSVRASAAEPSVRAALGALTDAPTWAPALEAAWSAIDTTTKARSLCERLETDLSRDVRKPSKDALVRLVELFSAWSTRLVEIEELTRESADVSEGAPAGGAALGPVVQAFELLTEDVHGPGMASFEQTMAAFRSSLDLRTFIGGLETSTGALAESVLLPKPETPPSEAGSAKEIQYRRIEPRKIAERLLARDAVLDLEHVADRAEEAPRLASRSVVSAFDAMRLQVRAAQDEPDADEARNRVLVALGAGREQIDTAVQSLSETERDLIEQLSSSLKEKLREFEAQIRLGGSTAAELASGGYLRRLIERTKDRGWRAARLFGHFLRKAERLLSGVAQSELAVEVQTKFRAGELDASSVRAYLERNEPDASLSDYLPYFQSGPLRETSYFVAHKQVLFDLIDAEHRWTKGGPSSIAVVGDPGSGRTTLLNLLQHGCYSKRVVRPNPVEWRRKVGLVQALSYELGSRPHARFIEKALGSEPALIIVDDLEQWFSPGLEGLAALEAFLDLVAKTTKSAFWAVSMNAAWFDLANSLTNVSGSFCRVSRLERVPAVDLREVIERRHQATGRPLVFPSTILGSVLSRGRVDRDRDLFFKVLSRISGGNLSRALALWLHIVQIDEEGAVRVRLARTLVAGLPFLKHLSAEQLAVLVLLHRQGPLSALELSDELSCALPVVRRELTFLLGTGLVQEDQRDNSLIRVTSTWAPYVGDALREVKAL